MARIFYKELDITGVADEETSSNVFTVPASNHYRIIGAYMNVSAVQGATIKSYNSRENIMGISDYLVGTGAVPTEQFLPMEVDLPAGEQFNMALLCTGTANDLRCCIAYVEV